MYHPHFVSGFHVVFIIGMDPGGAQEGPGPLGSNFIFFIVIICLLSVVGSFFQNLKSSINLVSLIQIVTIKPKNLTKIIIIFTIVIVFWHKKLLYHQKTKKSFVIGEVQVKFFTTIVN